MYVDNDYSSKTLSRLIKSIRSNIQINISSKSILSRISQIHLSAIANTYITI